MSFMNHNIGALISARVGTGLGAARAAGTVNGAAIDRKPIGGTGFDSAKLVVITGAESGSPTARSSACTIQDSDDGTGGWVNYTPPHGVATLTVAAASSIGEVSVDLSSAKRFIRVVDVVAFTGGTSPTLFASSVVVLGGADELPL
jgi:hypothetical protein